MQAEHPTVGPFRTVRSPVSFDGERALKVTAPPLLGEHNDDFRDGWRSAGAVALGMVSGAAQAQDFPARPVRMVVPFGPGTTTDIISRVIGEALAKPLGQNVVMENRLGAGGSIGTDLVAKAPPDGYTLVMGTVGTHAINASLFRRLSYDPLKDFVPIAFIGYTPTLVTRLRDAADQAMASSEVRSRLGAQGVELRTMKPEELAAFGRSEIDKWSDLVKRSGARVD